MKPARSILDKSFEYRDSASTDIRKTFARIRREMAAAKPKLKAPAIPIKRQASK